MILRFNLKKTLIASFVALGPLGNILTPHFLPTSFRAYYVLLPLFPLFFLFATKERIVKIGILFLPLFLYCALSAFFVETLGSANEPHTVFRFFLLLCQFFFILGAAASLRNKTEPIQLIQTYLNFYYLSLSIGYTFFIGYYLKIFPLWLLDRFSVLTQFGFGILRFSPGSYPNEYGIVSSFVLSILTLLYLEKNPPLSKKRISFFFFATFIAFLLTTTRAAYLSYFICLIYLTWKSGKFLKYFSYFTLSILTLFTLLLFINLNMFRILSAGFTQKLTEGSLGERYFLWQEIMEKGEEGWLFGVGFGSLTNAHNVYLQLLFELGCIGTILLLGTLAFSFLESFFKFRRSPTDETSIFFSKIRMVGLINVLSFAASNHNLNHHLTWFVFFLCLATLRLPYLNPPKEVTA